jgi:hypothetical protein
VEIVVTRACPFAPAPARPFTAAATALLAAVAAVATGLGGASWGVATAVAVPPPPVATPADPAPCPMRWLLASGRVRAPRGLPETDSAVRQE